MGNTEVYEKLESDINPNERKSNHFSQLTTEEKIWEKEVHDGEVEEGRGVIRSVKIDNKQNWEKHHVPPTDGVATMFFHSSAVGSSI